MLFAVVAAVLLVDAVITVALLVAIVMIVVLLISVVVRVFWERRSLNLLLSPWVQWCRSR